jgi:hypothetical protein
LRMVDGRGAAVNSFGKRKQGKIEKWQTEQRGKPRICAFPRL